MTKNQQDQKNIAALMEFLEKGVAAWDGEFSNPGETSVKFIRREGKKYSLKFRGETFEVEFK